MTESTLAVAHTTELRISTFVKFQHLSSWKNFGKIIKTSDLGN